MSLIFKSFPDAFINEFSSIQHQSCSLYLPVIVSCRFRDDRISFKILSVEFQVLYFFMKYFISNCLTDFHRVKHQLILLSQLNYLSSYNGTVVYRSFDPTGQPHNFKINYFAFSIEDFRGETILNLADIQ